MALTSNASYIPTVNEFLAHWAQADTALPSGGIILAEEPGIIPSAFNRSGLQVLRDALRDKLDEVQDLLNGVQIAQGTLELLKQKMNRRLQIFLALLDGYYANTEYYRARPESPGIGAGEEKFCAPLRDMKSLWLRLMNAPAPAGVSLMEFNEGTAEAPQNFTREMFVNDLALLQQHYSDRASAEQAVKLARAQRDKLFKQIRAVLVAYRAAALSKLAARADLLDSLPRVSPQPGHTPDAVSVSAAFIPPDTAQITHSESADSDFKEYQLRGVPGDDGDLEDAVVLATHTGRAPQAFTTQHGLGSPGGAASLWITVVTTDGNERSSERVVVLRPV